MSDTFVWPAPHWTLTKQFILFCTVMPGEQWRGGGALAGTAALLVVARLLVCVISWRLTASLLDGLRWSSSGLVLCISAIWITAWTAGVACRCLVGGSTAGLPRGRRIAAGRLSLAVPGDRRSGCPEKGVVVCCPADGSVVTSLACAGSSV
jgi:hypothetical protein